MLLFDFPAPKLIFSASVQFPKTLKIHDMVGTHKKKERKYGWKHIASISFEEESEET